MNQVDQILDKMKRMLISFHFSVIEINGVTNYVYGSLYCIPHYIRQIGFFFEYAHSLEEAQKNWYGDGDGFPLEMGEKAILAGLEEEIRQSVER